MFLEIHPENPEPRKIQQVVDCLKNGGLVIYPTDTVYAIGCDIYQPKAIEKLCLIKGVKSNKMSFSFICNDLSHISEFTLNLDTPIYKLMKRLLPGAYTFILKANNSIPKLFKNKKKTVGIRIPNHNIPRMIVEELGNPIITTSIHHDDEIIDYITDPYYIYEQFGNRVDIVIDGGMGGIVPSTIINCTDGYPELVRQGKGEVDF
ncbi:MAG TPA: L-threonylcarbamoyladenylate synthase [Chitinophagales bacterium]|nr:L-threonylcarbamoyladenylate synthase [Chitinophagales bacterium]